MKNHQTATRIIAGVLPAMALFATPALAQELQTQTTPPPVPTVSAPAPTAPAAAAPSGASGTVSQEAYEASVRAATGNTAPADAPAVSAAPARSAARATPVRRAAPVAPVAATPAVAAPTPVAAAPEAAPSVTQAPTTAAEPAATTTAPVTEATTTETSEITSSGFPVWGWALVGLAVLAALAGAATAMRRRRERDEWAEEEVYYEEQPVAHDAAVAAPIEAAPLAAAPLAEERMTDEAPIAEHADVVAPEAAEIAAITEGAAPVAGRPWIELSLRPVRAGATDEAALVDLELTLANAGEVAAEDVRVSTFMLGDASAAPTEMDRLLATGHAGAAVEAGAIGAGEGSRIDARLAVPRGEMEGATFQPVVVADVRYRLPNGDEGRTAAAFTVGVQDDGEGEPSPLRLGGDMREDVAASLHGVPERV